MNIFTQKHKLLHKLKKKNEYSIHSPYMFDLYNRLIKKNRTSTAKIIHLMEEEFGKENVFLISSSYKEYQNIQTKLNDNSIIIIEKPYSNKISYLEFQKMISDPRRVVVVDLFSIGIISQNPKLSTQEYIL